MFEEKNVYKVSVLAKRSRGPSGDYEIEHRPLILHAESIKAAEADVKERAFEIWSKEDGWQDYEAYIAPTTTADFTAITGMTVRGPIIKTAKDDQPKLIKFQAT